MEVSLGSIYWNSLSWIRYSHANRTELRLIAPYSEGVETRLRRPQDVGGVGYVTGALPQAVELKVSSLVAARERKIRQGESK